MNYVQFFQDGGKYTVKKGDNLSKIALAHGMSLKLLLSQNPNVDPKKYIYPGQVLNVSSNTIDTGDIVAPGGSAINPGDYDRLLAGATPEEIIAINDQYTKHVQDTIDKLGYIPDELKELATRLNITAPVVKKTMPATLTVKPVEAPKEEIKPIVLPSGEYEYTDRFGIKHKQKYRVTNPDNVDITDKSGIATLINNETIYGGVLPEVVKEAKRGEKGNVSAAERWQYIQEIMNNPEMPGFEKYHNLLKAHTLLDRLSDKEWEWLELQEGFGKIKRDFEKNDKILKERERKLAKMSPEEKEAYMQRLELSEEMLSNPDFLFSKDNKKYRDKFTVLQWLTVLKAHPEFLNKDNPYHKYIPSSYTKKGEQVYQNIMNSSIREGRDKFGQYMGAAMLSAANPLAGAASISGGLLTDQLVQSASNGKYDNWGDMVEYTLGLDSNNPATHILAYASNPGAAIGATLGQAATGGLTTGTYNGTIQSPNKGMYMEVPTVVKTTSRMPWQAGGGKRWGMGGATFNGGGQQSYGLGSELQTWGGGNINYKMPYLTATPYIAPYVPLTLDRTKGVIQKDDYEPIPFPAMQQYSTLYSWGDPDFVKWWMKNNTPENQGKSLYYPGGDGNGGRWVIIRNGGLPIGTNIDASQDAGVYVRPGSQSVQTLNSPVLSYVPYTGQPFYGTEVGISPRAPYIGSPAYGTTISLEKKKNGGMINYSELF